MSLVSALNARRITAALAGQDIGKAVEVHEELVSTNDRARDLGQAGHPHGTIVLAEHQSAGRGRRENVWNASPRQNLLLSLLLHPPVRMELWPRATTLAALALCRAVEDQTQLRPAIKWPNDVYLRDKKCAGILAETFSGPEGAFLVLGIGVNVNEAAFPPELRETATSLRLQSGAEQDRNTFVISFLKCLESLFRNWDSGFDGVVDQVRQRSWLLGRAVTAWMGDQRIEGLAADLDPEGHLVLRLGDGRLETLTSAEQVRPHP